MAGWRHDRTAVTGLTRLNTLPEAQAAQALRACCGSSRWVTGMLALRPFRSVAELHRAAEERWQALGPADWKEAFDRHPRIGERVSAGSQDARAASWSNGEQAGMQTAEQAVRVALAEVNRDYEVRFGYIYIVCAAGRSAEELLVEGHRRLANTPETELLVAAAEQLKITRLRLDKVIADSG
ncbi:MAG: 2-oxo-4-hydroxy-4-carboxy-5-ureidoimidazoline decarboxylase [Gemmatimonadales bacterium]